MLDKSARMSTAQEERRTMIIFWYTSTDIIYEHSHISYLRLFALLLGLFAGGLLDPRSLALEGHVQPPRVRVLAKRIQKLYRGIFREFPRQEFLRAAHLYSHHTPSNTELHSVREEVHQDELQPAL
jgi:hypothetical protein